MENIISIIMPVYNVESFLEEALYSIEKQTSKNFELIIVNDGSTDNSGEIINRFEKTYSNNYKINIINQENKGLSEARNTGIKAARGSYIYFFDSDDLIDPSMIEIVETQIKRNVDLIKFNASQFYDKNFEKNGKPRSISSKLFINNRIINKKKLMHLSRFSFQAPVWLYVYKSSIIKENNLFFKPKLIFEDELYNAIYFLYVNRFLYINKKLFIRRLRSGSITTSEINLKDNLKNKGIVMESIKEVFIDSNNNLERKFLLSRLKRLKQSILNDLTTFTS